MEAALGSLGLTVAVTLYLAIALWGTKVAPPLDAPDTSDPARGQTAARPR